MEGDKLKPQISKEPTGVFYVDNNKALFYEESQKSSIQIDISGDIISDLEVISKKKLVVFIQQFVEAHKIAPKNIFILLSSLMTFEKEFPEGSPEPDKSISEFLELVPFEDYLSKQISIKGKIKVVAANRELCEAIKGAFSQLGFVVVGVFPLSLIEDILPELRTKFDFNLIISKITEFREFNFSSEVETITNIQKQEVKSNKRILILVGIFIVSLVILFIVVYLILESAQSPKPLPSVK